MSISEAIKTQTYRQWVCDECGNEYSTHSIAVECSEKHVFRGEFEIGEFLTRGEIVKIEYKRETIARLLIERPDGTRSWMSGFSAKYYEKKITDPENYR